MAGPAPALLCAPGRSWLALLGPQLPPLCEGYLWEWTLVPVVAGRGLLPTVTNLSQFAEDFPGLSTASPVSWELPQPQANKDGWSPCCQGHFSFHHVLPTATPVSASAVSTRTLELIPSLPVQRRLLPAPSLSPGLSHISLSLPLTAGPLSPCSSLLSLCWGSLALPACLWGLSVSSPVPRSVTLLVSGVCLSILCPLLCLPSPSLVSHSLCLPVPVPGSLAHHLPWVVQASLLSPGMHPQGWLGWEPGLGAVTGPGRGTQADMIFMLGLQSGAGPGAGVVGAGRGGTGGGWRAKARLRSTQAPPW